MTVLLSGVTLTIFALINYKIYQAKKKCSVPKALVQVPLVILPHQDNSNQQPSQCLKITQDSLILQCFEQSNNTFNTFSSQNANETFCVNFKHCA